MGEFLVRNFSIAIGVDLLDDLLDNLLVEVLAEGKDLLDLSNGDGTTAIFVEHPECSLQLIVTQEVLLVKRCHNELRVLDFTRAISIDFVKQVVDFLVSKLAPKEFSISFLDLVLLELAVTIQIHGSENLVDLLFFLLGEQLRGNESVSGLLQL